MVHLYFLPFVLASCCVYPISPGALGLASFKPTCPKGKGACGSCICSLSSLCPPPPQSFSPLAWIALIRVSTSVENSAWFGPAMVLRAGDGDAEMAADILGSLFTDGLRVTAWQGDGRSRGE